MNEFENWSKEELKLALVGLISYRRSAIDTSIIIAETFERTIKFYDDKINILEEIASKLENK